MQKWNEPKGPPPSYLDPADEVTTSDPKLPKDQFVVYCMNALLRLGCSVNQAAGVAANAINESAWGQIYTANNLYGWKITKAAAIAYRLAHDGKGPKWWSAPGNKAPGATLKDYAGGDPPWCYYRAFDSIEESLAQWLKYFVPKPAETVPYPGYKRCGELFWSGGDWFPALISVGYKGANTKKHPEQAIEEHKSLCQSAIVRWAQSRLGVEVDGNFGANSHARCVSFQIAKGIRPTGELDDATTAALASLN